MLPVVLLRHLRGGTASRGVQAGRVDYLWSGKLSVRLTPYATSRQPSHASSTNITLETMKKDREDIASLLPDVFKDLTNEDLYRDIADFPEILSKILRYNIPSRNFSQSLAVVQAFRMIATPQQLTPENIKLSMKLGLCCEIAEEAVVITDDFLDDSVTRYGRPTWHKLHNRGAAAINDSLVLTYSVYKLLCKYFRHQPYSIDLMHILFEECQRAVVGQSLDLSRGRNETSTFDTFTMDSLRAIHAFKAARAGCYWPVAAAMYMSGNIDLEVLKKVDPITAEIGILVQVMNDNDDYTNDAGTDIQNGRVSWPAVAALERSNHEQRKIMEECYGSSDPHKVARVKDLYRDLNLKHVFEAYQVESSNKILLNIEELPTKFSVLMKTTMNIFGLGRTLS